MRFGTKIGTVVIMRGYKGLQGHEEDVFYLRCHQVHLRFHCLRGDRIGEADHPAPVMEALVRAFSVAWNVVLLAYIVVHSFCDELRVTSSLAGTASTHANCFLAVNESV